MRGSPGCASAARGHPGDEGRLWGTARAPPMAGLRVPGAAARRVLVTGAGGGQPPLPWHSPSPCSRVGDIPHWFLWILSFLGEVPRP